jgi:hypothetical protein
LKLKQTLDATLAPTSTEAYFVLTGKSEIGVSASSAAYAEAVPALLRAIPNRVEPHSLFLVADEDFAPAARFPSGEKSLATVLLLQLDTATLPPGKPYTSPADSRDSIIDDVPGERVTLQNVTSVADTAWDKLFERTSVLDVLSKVAAADRDTVSQAMAELFNVAISDSKPIYVLLATYTRAEDDPAEPWTAPGVPAAVIQIQLLDPRNDFEKPKSALTLLHGKQVGNDSAAAETFSHSGFGRLGDDDFQPIRPVPFQPPASAPMRVGWARIAELQSLDRLGAGALSPNSEDSVFDFDVIFYGPGGELIPTIDPRAG